MLIGSKFIGFAKYLIEQNLLSETTFEKITSTTSDQNEPLITKIIANNLLDNTILAQAIANYFKMPFIDLSQLQYNKIPYNILPPKIIQKHLVLPIAKIDQQLQLALADPTDTLMLNAIKPHTSLNIKPVIAAHDQLKKAIIKILPSQHHNSITEKEDSITKFIDQILSKAIDKQASDIHFEPYGEYYRIRFRIDGLLYEITKTDLSLGQRFSARLKIMANLNIAEKRLPQDGRFSLKLADNKNYDCRLSSCPTLFGEKLVVRILNPINLTPDIKYLGFNKKELQLFCEYIGLPQGMVLVTGPTGSGKTITLYTAINILNQTTKNISTVEDPIEINLSGVNQVEVNHKIGLDFATVLRAFLRQDPDAIMVGEIRDLETAEIAIKAAYTGHLLLATLHTNSATSSLMRLLNMGIPAFNLATALKLIMAQRLIRKLCPHCKLSQTLSAPILIANNLEEGITTYVAKGCNHCNQGYLGRTAIFEMLPITPTISDMIMHHCNITEIENEMHKLNCLTLRENGLDKVRTGVTSLEEINRVII